MTSVPSGNSDAKMQFWVLALILFAGYCLSSTLSSLSDKWMMKNPQRGPYDFGLCKACGALGNYRLSIIIEVLQFQQLLKTFIPPLMFSIFMVLDLILAIFYFSVEGAAQVRNKIELFLGGQGIIKFQFA